MHPMNRSFRLLAFVAVFGVAASGVHAAESAAASQVTVSFESPADFADFSKSYPAKDDGQEEMMTEFRAHLVHQARSLLGAGQRLEVRFLDIDLAGDFEPGRFQGGGDHIRFLKEIYPPRMTLEFRLLGADGKVISEGKRELKELGYLMTTRLPNRDSLRYDKALLTDWMRREFRRSSR